MLVQFYTPILAGYGILSFMPEQTKPLTAAQTKRWQYVFGGIAFVFLAGLLGRDIIKNIYSSFFSLQDVGKALAHSYGQLNPTVVEAMFDFVFSSVVTDILIGSVLAAIVLGAFYLYQKGKLSASAVFAVVAVAVLVDLWRVAWKPEEPRSRQESLQSMPTPDYVKAIQKDTSLFRTLKIVDGQPVYDNSLAYWRIQNAYGYQGAKMRIYQDMVDVAGLGNPVTQQLMNIKYIISNREINSPAYVAIYNSPEMKVYQSQFALPRVFFVNRCVVDDGLDVLKKIAATSFDPRDMAFSQDSITEHIDAPMPGVNAVVLRYGIQDMTIRATATGNNLLFISEAYYPKGWKASIDGKETNILRLDYMFRGVVVPPGTHTVEMKFEPASFTRGRTLSLFSNIVVLAGLVAQIIVVYAKRKKAAN
jgi:hypothetical protein